MVEAGEVAKRGTWFEHFEVADLSDDVVVGSFFDFLNSGLKWEEYFVDFLGRESGYFDSATHNDEYVNRKICVFFNYDVISLKFLIRDKLH